MPGGQEANDPAPDEDVSGDDDLSIADDAVLWRRIARGWYERSADGKLEAKSAAFSGDELSADLASIAQRPEVTRGQYLDAGVMEIDVADLRAEKLRIRRDPLPDNDAHVVVLGHKGKKMRRRLRDRARWVLEPPALGDGDVDPIEES